MTLDVIAIGGAPATGKSTLMSRVLEHTSEIKYNGNNFKWGELVGSFYTNDKTVIFGRYDGSKEREGTDVLSKSANNHAKQFTKMLTNIERFDTVVFEGDRLFNRPYLEMCREYEDIQLYAYVLTVDYDMLDSRHDERGDEQDEKWLSGMRTQYEKYETESWTTVLRNETVEDQDANLDEILAVSGLGDGDVDPSGKTREGFEGLGEFSSS